MASTLDTDAIAARLKNATPGPWGRMNDGPYMGTKPWTAYDEAAPGLTLASPANTEPICRVSGYCQPVEANADFIAAAPGDMAALLAEVATLREALKPFAATADFGFIASSKVTDRYGLFASSPEHMQEQIAVPLLLVGDLRRARRVLEGEA